MAPIAGIWEKKPAKQTDIQLSFSDPIKNIHLTDRKKEIKTDEKKAPNP